MSFPHTTHSLKTQPYAHSLKTQPVTVQPAQDDSRLNPARCLICIWHSLVWSLPPPRVWSRLGRESLSIARFNSSIKGWHSGTTRDAHRSQDTPNLGHGYKMITCCRRGHWTVGGGSCEISSLPNALLAPSSDSPAWHQGRWLGAPLTP